MDNSNVGLQAAKDLTKAIEEAHYNDKPRLILRLMDELKNINFDEVFRNSLSSLHTFAVNT
jgi:hypothetical protein